MTSSRHPDSGPSLPIGGGDAPVPAFGCTVFVSRREGQFEGRVANLAEITASAASQRELLAAIVKQFKAVVAKHVAEGEEPKWTDPPLEKRDDEQKLFLPVHL